MTGGDPTGGTGGTGGVGSPFDSTGTSDPPVNQNTVLGSWDNGFLQGNGESWTNPGWTPDPSTQALIGDLTSLIRELTNILGSLAGSWSPDGENGGGVGTPNDWRGHEGSAGAWDQGGKPHHHDLWKPDQQ